MKKRSLWLITTLMTIALLGVFVMQLYYIKEAYNLKSQLFEQNVSEALNDVVNKVQKRYAANHISRKDRQLSRDRDMEVRNQAKLLVEFKERFAIEQHKRDDKMRKLIAADLNQTEQELVKTYKNPVRISENDFLAASDLENPSESPIHQDVVVGFDQDGNIVSGQIKTSFTPGRGNPFRVRNEVLPDSLRYTAIDPVSNRPVLVSVKTISTELERQYLLENNLAQKKYQEGLKRLMSDTIPIGPDAGLMLGEVAQEMRSANIPLSKIVSRDLLDTLIKKELFNRNITLPYDFWVSLAQKDSLVYRKASHADLEPLPRNTYQVTLTNFITRDPGMLFVNFPDRNSLIIGNMWATMASSAGLLLVLIFIFAYTIYAIIRQKKISEMKTDFINNMTHEFKTPVATIMIASEALKDPEIVEDKKRISRLAGIIYDENVRLGNHIERVLSIARLEKKELKLERTEVNMNDLIVAVADSMDLQLQRREAVIHLGLNAEQPVITGDELHLSNVIYNLIDNANKYSLGQPKITLNTRSSHKHLYIEVIDEGIGMTKEQSKRIFDQFYRVPTGNLHDVKGFGLGLNYVHDIITQMGGTIRVNSEKDKGTKFEISLPLNQN